MKQKIIACEVMRDELLLTTKREDVEITFLDCRLHNYPQRLRGEIQREIDISNDFVFIILGYGLCGKGTVSIRAKNCPIVIPRVEDCIALFLTLERLLRPPSTP